MEAVSSTLGDDVHDGARCMPLLGVKVCRNDLELLNRIAGGYESHAQPTSHIRCAVQRELAASRRSRGANRRDAAIVERPRKQKIAGERQSAGNTRQDKGIAIGKRKVLDAALVNDLASRGFCCLEQRCRCRHMDFLQHGAELQLEVHRQPIPDSEFDTATLQLLEPRRLYPDLVLPRRQIEHRVVSGIIRGGVL